MVPDPYIGAEVGGGGMTLRELYRRSPMLTVTGWIHWILAAVLGILWQLDSRTILGINPWIKPLKFSISIAIYVWTLGWYLGYLLHRTRAVAIISWGVSMCMLVEISGIAMQAARGVPSHFNVATAFDATVFSVMGATIGINSMLVLWTFILFFAASFELPAAYLWGIRFGLLVFLLASAEGVLMVAHGSHTVGAPDGGPGLPLVNWSREHGDLRVMHFAGMHALQILPLAGYWLTGWRRPETMQVACTVVLFLAYVGAMAVLFWIAWQGRPVLAV